MSNFDPIKYLFKYRISLTQEMIDRNAQKKVILGMSGGVDSSVAAAVLKLQGYDVLGIFMKNWEEKDENGVCTSEADYKDVISVCERLDISYHSIDFVKEYRENVFSHFLKEYEMGYTPNPDILCNREIKFKVFYDLMIKLGGDFLATGHYCQNIDNQLVKGIDEGKDQTYFLYAIDKNVLPKVLFPLGHLLKKEVREIANDFDLSTKAKKDSTGICFIGERNFKNFLSQYIQAQKGKFVNIDNDKVLGDHDGQCFYTMGQRKGLGLGGPGGPWFVVKKDPESNIVYVAEGDDHPALYSDTLWTKEINFLKDVELPITLKAKIRYRAKDETCLISQDGDYLKIVFQNPQRGISLRQSVVFYDGDICIGGGIINKIGPSLHDLNKTHEHSTSI